MSHQPSGTSSALGAAFMVLAAFSAATYAVVSPRVAAAEEPLGLVTRLGLATLAGGALILVGLALITRVELRSHRPSAPEATLAADALAGQAC